MPPIALTIAGSDPSGGAGLQADLKTFHQHGVYGCSVVTLLTVQNTQTVADVRVLEPAFVEAQLDAVISDLPPTAAKTGALGSAAVIEAVAARAAEFDFPLIVDPVMVSKHGQPLIDTKASRVLRDTLLPRAYLVTPNVKEAEALTGRLPTDEASLIAAARRIQDLGAQNVLIKAGHFQHDAMDVLLVEDEVICLRNDSIATRSTHGTGCVLSAAISACLARGESLIDAVSGAKAFVTEAIRTAPPIGNGYGPTNMLVQP